MKIEVELNEQEYDDLLEIAEHEAEEFALVEAFVTWIVKSHIHDEMVDVMEKYHS